MNNKGFTLIELLAIVLLLAILSTIGTYAVSSYIKASRTKSDDLLWDNIKVAAQEYIDECTSGVSSLECSITTSGGKKTTKPTIGDLANAGFLNAVTDDSGNIIVRDSKENNLKDCKIKITKTVDANYVVTYNVTIDNTDPDNKKINCGEIKNKS